MKDKSVAILYVCTGKYVVFWKDFYLSFEEKFLQGIHKEYFVYTDSPRIYNDDIDVNVHRIYQKNLGWPGNTLMRFEMFMSQSKALESFDFTFFLNANALCVTKVEESDILPNNEDIVVVQHPAFVNTNRYLFPYERRKASTAYIPYREGKYYVIGAINGGKTSAYLHMANELKERTDRDLKNNLIAIWHDESQLNKYISDYDNFKILSPSFCYPEGWTMEYDPKIMMRDKDKYFSVAKIKKNSFSVIISGIKRHLIFIVLCIDDMFRRK